ncbi:hypothetical protein H4R20_004373 [Coemansia guatemalensis]|uniref:LIM zinc-binding domain-containing protein n=1 Tax=Coemansia guatemalensis TaxID=2761395 RepID=A0A9W8HTF6_9FUNG|nr:hypothetical protein H4R20_004373 [Coemansia guatemalensis]
MLASLVPSDPRALPRSASMGRHATPPPNSQMSPAPKRNGAPNTNGMAPKGMAAMPPSGRRLKSAKLDSLLDDLMGEMQALSAEGRTESDRESLVSTASAGASVASPLDPHAGAEMTIEDIRRARLDSTVSSTSTSSTMSNGTPHKRQLHCTACGTSVANTGRGSIARASGLPRNGDIPAGVQGIEYQGRVYCVRDYRRQISHLCRGCGQPCESNSSRDAVHALDSWWHRKCFNCQKCHRQFPDKSFYVFEHLPYCRYDYHRLNRSLCAACEEPIEGPCAQVYEGRFHPSCFACAQCGESLRDVYYSLDGHFFCEQHVHQHKPQTSAADKRKTVFGHI